MSGSEAPSGFDPAPFDAGDYRRALGGFGTGVALVAAHDANGVAHGMIINSLTSVSLHPPIMLWCLANASAAFGVFTQATAFSLNILRSDDHSVAQQFSRRGGDRIIPPEQYCAMDTGAPVLSSALASLDCRMRLRQPMGGVAFRWVRDESIVPASDPRWVPGEPNNGGAAGGEDCAHAYPSGFWNDTVCSADYIESFLCERQ